MTWHPIFYAYRHLLGEPSVQIISTPWKAILTISSYGPHKIIFEVLSNRLKVLYEIVSTLQIVFVEGKQILDTALAAYVVIDSRRKENHGFCANWILRSLMIMLTVSFLISLYGRWFWCQMEEMDQILHLNSQVFMSGNPCCLFGSARGVRQGAPLSPMFFILVTIWWKHWAGWCIEL